MSQIIDYDLAMELTDKLPKVHGQAIRVVLQDLRHRVAMLQQENQTLLEMSGSSAVTDLDSRMLCGSEYSEGHWFRLPDTQFQFALPGPLFQRRAGAPLRPCSVAQSEIFPGALRLIFDDSVAVHQSASNVIDIFSVRTSNIANIDPRQND